MERVRAGECIVVNFLLKLKCWDGQAKLPALAWGRLHPQVGRQVHPVLGVSCWCQGVPLPVDKAAPVAYFCGCF